MPDKITRVKAQVMRDGMDKNERAGIQFGLFPAEKMRRAEAEGFVGRDLCVALMEIARRDGGMRA